MILEGVTCCYKNVSSPPIHLFVYRSSIQEPNSIWGENLTN